MKIFKTIQMKKEDQKETINIYGIKNQTIETLRAINEDVETKKAMLIWKKNN